MTALNPLPVPTVSVQPDPNAALHARALTEALDGFTCPPRRQHADELDRRIHALTQRLKDMSPHHSANYGAVWDERAALIRERNAQRSGDAQPDRSVP